MSYFEQVIGQQDIIAHVSDLVKRQTLPHSLLFYGESGLGKLQVAIGLASLLIGRPVFSPDNGQTYLDAVKQARMMDGESEKASEAQGLPIYMDKGDAFWLRPMKASLKVEQWYELLSEYLNKVSDNNRVVIVEDFQTANAVMANAMLKTIEEPPRNTYFIIITNQIANVLPTILSRCMSLSFGPVEDAVIEAALRKEGITGDLSLALGAGQGNPKMVRQFATESTVPLLHLAMDLLELLPEPLFFSKGSFLTEQLTRDELKELMSWMRLLSRDMMALRFGSGDDVLQCVLFKERMLRLLPKWSARALLKVQSETLNAEEALRLYIKANLVMDGVLIALRQIIKEDTQ
ncbi:DNA polymerase III subunit delta' [uncultured Veillonella sp.]|uniref:DNA polymerase III subunit delta' n=1 Tax=uncultured Veillonella sp. TaxID=159268 RepID=UPI00260A5324|nr:DNA polymerase III subunit delta' [uncultured Veillonella sp.]